MHPCFCRHRALAFGGGSGTKNGSGIRDAKPEDANAIANYINNSDHIDEEKITQLQVEKMKMKKGVKRIQVSEEEEYDADDIDLFSTYSVMVYS
jgi:hypothetical protein